MTAVLLGVGLGLYLGWKKSDELISAGTAFVTAAATAKFTGMMEDDEEEE
jgi:hypothetical protein